jgi:peptide/nickel transport system substrate-binding protein
MTRKFLAAALRLACGALPVVGVLLLGAAQGLAQTPKRGGTLNVGLHIDLLHYDWHATVAHPFPHVMGQVFEGLTAFGKDFSAVPELAESIEATSDGLQWTFKLREGVPFHNGKEMTAEDVQASIERWRKVGPKGTILKNLDRYEIVSKYLLRMHFKEPMGRFLLLALGSDENKAIIMPKEIAQKYPEATKIPKNEVVGTGPFQFVEHKPDQYIRLKRFDKYKARGDAPNYQSGRKTTWVDEVVFWVVEQNTTRIAGIETGEYDIITDIPDTEFDRLKSVKGVTPVKNGPGLLLYMMFNHKKGPTANIDIRRAIQAATDPNELIASVVSNREFGLVNPSFFPPESPYNNPERSEIYGRADINKAKELLKTAGYANEELKLQVISTNAIYVRLLTAAAEQLKRAGINAVVVRLDRATWQAKRRDGDYLNMYNSGGYWFDPSLYEPEFNGTFPSKDVAFYSPEVERVFEGLARETTFEKRFALAKELQRLFYDQVATLNLGYIYRLIAKRDHVVDPEGNLALGNLTLHGVWLNK